MREFNWFRIHTKLFEQIYSLRLKFPNFLTDMRPSDQIHIFPCLIQILMRKEVFWAENLQIFKNYRHEAAFFVWPEIKTTQKLLHKILIRGLDEKNQGSVIYITTEPLLRTFSKLAA